MTTDADLNWGAFDQARGTKPRQPAAQQQPGAQQYAGVIPLSPAAMAQVRKIQKEAGLPETGELDSATVAYTQKHYNTASTTQDGAKKKAKAKSSGGSKSKSKSSSSTSSKSRSKTLSAHDKKVAKAKAKAKAAKVVALKKELARETKNANHLAAVAAMRGIKVTQTATLTKGVKAEQAAAKKAATVKTARKNKIVGLTKSGKGQIHAKGISLANETSNGETMSDTDLAFKGKKAAPFVKGGGRSKQADNDAKGRTRKVKQAKAKARATRMRSGATLDNAITPGGRVGDASPLGKPGSKRQLSDYEREVVHGILRKNPAMKLSKAIAIARGVINHAAATGRWSKGKAKPNVVAGAVASIAQRASFSNDHEWSDSDLANVVNTTDPMRAAKLVKAKRAAALNRKDAK